MLTEADSLVPFLKSKGIFLIALSSFGIAAGIAGPALVLLPADTTIYIFLIIGMAPVAMAYSIVSAYDRDINTRVPELFYDLSEHVRASGSMTKALKRATSGNYGVISEEVWRVLSEIEHEGNSLAAALKAMAARVGNAYVTRSVSIINEAMTSSSDMEGVLKMVSADGRLSRTLEAERRSGISQAVMVMYLTAFVFLIVVSLCITSFVPVSYQLSAMSAGEQYVPGNNYSSTMPYYALSISVAACSGVAIGVMRDMTVYAGFKDAAALVTIVFLIFRMIVFPGINPMEVFGL